MNIHRLINHYRVLHQFPEPGFREIRTSEYLRKTLSVIPGLSIHTAAQTGIIAIRKGSSPEKTIAFRADMDGLPITENTGLPFSSKHSGFMHACGHDGHMAILLEFITSTVSESYKNNMMFIFQPAEEGPGGAPDIIKSSFFQEYRPDMIFGLHVFPELPAGSAASKSGSFFAGVAEFYATVTGNLSHAAANDQRNALLGAVETVCRINARHQKIKEKHLLHFGKFNSGIRENITAPDAKFSGTLRAFSVKLKSKLKQLVDSELKKTGSNRNLEVLLKYDCDYPVLINSVSAFNLLLKACHETNTVFQDYHELFLGEDFAYYLEQIPGVFFLLGINDSSCKGRLHTSDFCFNPENLVTGVNIFKKLADFTCT